MRELKMRGLVAIFLGNFDPAIEIAMCDIAPSEDDETGLQLLFVSDKCHCPTFYCAGTVLISGVSI